MFSLNRVVYPLSCQVFALFEEYPLIIKTMLAFQVYSVQSNDVVFFFYFFKYIGAPIQSLSEVKAQMMNGSAGSLSRTNSTSSVDKTEGKSSEKVHRR